MGSESSTRSKDASICVVHTDTCGKNTAVKIVCSCEKHYRTTRSFVNKSLQSVAVLSFKKIQQLVNLIIKPLLDLTTQISL